MRGRHVKLNRCLDPEEFELWVSTDCKLLLDDYEPDRSCRTEGQEVRRRGDKASRKALVKYVESLGLRVQGSGKGKEKDGDRTRGDRKKEEEESEQGQEKEEYCLRGPYAIEHAQRVLARIRRQVLRYRDVTAVDVGFAVEQRRKRFRNMLAIRVHFGKKLPVKYLRRKALPGLVDPIWAARAGVQWKCDERLADDLKLKPLAKLPRDEAPQGPWDYPISGVSRSDLSFIPDPYPGGPTTDESSEATGKAPANREKKKEEEASGDGADDSDAGGGCCRKCRCRCHCCCRKCGRCCYCCSCAGSKHGCCECCHWHGRVTICGVPLDIIEANYFPSSQHPGGDYPEGVFVEPMQGSAHLSNRELSLTGRGKVTPLVGGVSVGSVNGLAGTLSTIVWDETDGTPCALGNWHVLAGTGGEVGQPCFQPSLFDGGCHDDVIGHLKRWHLGDLGDAAIAQLDGSRDFASGEILGMWQPISGYEPPALNLEIRKWGRTTGFTKGFIDGIDLATNIDYGNGVIRHFEDQFHIAPLFSGQEVSQVGDSGALVLASYDLDDLDVIARGMIRKENELVEKLLPLIGDPKIEDIEDLAKQVREALEEWRQEVMESGCRLTANLPSEEELLFSMLEGGQPVATAQADRGSQSDDGAERVGRFEDLVYRILERNGFDVEEARERKVDRECRKARNVYRAVGMIFAGDTPGSPFGEFALASDIKKLAEDLRFSLRPVFESRSSFRKLRSTPPGRYRHDHGRRRRLPLSAREPGEQRPDPRGGGPQPDGEEYQSGSGGTGGGG